MSAEMLREAAALMRSRAKASRAGRWVNRGDTVVATWSDGPRLVAELSGSTPEGNQMNAEHVASWDPGVALAVADWLDAEAQIRDQRQAEVGRIGSDAGWDVSAVVVPVNKAALEVARAYLQRT